MSPSIAALVALLALCSASCGGEATVPAEDDAAERRARRSDRRRCLRGRHHRPAEGGLRHGQAHGVDRPGVPAAVLAQRGDRRVRGLRHRRRHRDRQAARRRRRLGDARLGRHHRRQLERPLGHERRLDDADQRPAEGPRLHPAVLLHAGRRRGEQATTPTCNDLATDLDGKKIGVCSGCTYEQFLNKTLAIKGFTFDFIIDDAEVSGYDTDTTALQDLALGDGTRLDAVITSLTTAQGYIDAGKPVKIVGDPVFYEPLAVAIDKSVGPVAGEPRSRRSTRSSGRCTRTAR